MSDAMRPHALIRVLEEGILELETNPVENQIRPIVLTRKNALFAGKETGAENRAMAENGQPPWWPWLAQDPSRNMVAREPWVPDGPVMRGRAGRLRGGTPASVADRRSPLPGATGGRRGEASAGEPWWAIPECSAQQVRYFALCIPQQSA